MPVPAHRHRETFSHLIGSYSYILYGRVANPLYIDVRLVAHGQVPDPCMSCEYSILWEGFEFIKGTSGESS